MNSIFEKAFKELILIERGYVNDPNDNGGKTKYGISKRAYPNLNIKDLTLTQAKTIYLNDYWMVIRLDYIDNESIAIELFDTAVNMGTVTSAKLFQKSLNLLNRNNKTFKDLKVDGKIGQKTLQAYYKVDKKILLKVLNGMQFMRYVKIVEKNPNQEVFFNGWMKRV